MANTLDTNPAFIDTFGADVTITSNRANIKCITFSSPGADHCVLTDTAGNTVVDSRVAANTTDNQSIETSSQGLIVDVSQGSFTAAAALLVYFN